MGEGQLKNSLINEILGKIKIKYQLMAIPILFIVCNIGVLIYSFNTVKQHKIATQYTELKTLEDDQSSRIIEALLESHKAKLEANVAGMLRTQVYVFIVIAVLGFIISFLVIGDIDNSMREITAKADEIGNGNLTNRNESTRTDEIGDAFRAIEKMRRSISDMIENLQENTNQIVSVASTIGATSSQLASGAEDQTSQTAEVAASIHEMTANIAENSKNANDTAQLVSTATDMAQSGSNSMEKAHSGMEKIVQSATRTVTTIQSLAQRANEIGDIIGVIDEIADQTNLLALNAAIEAARAGEQGRGFAVVADEVRKLAERTTRATAEVGNTIKAIQQETQEAEIATNQTEDVIHSGQEAIEETKALLAEIMGSINNAMSMITQIAAATHEMNSAAEEISHNVNAISNVTRESAEGAEQLAGAAKQLNDQTDNLNVLMNKFKLV